MDFDDLAKNQYANHDTNPEDRHVQLIIQAGLLGYAAGEVGCIATVPGCGEQQPKSRADCCRDSQSNNDRILFLHQVFRPQD